MHRVCKSWQDWNLILKQWKSKERKGSFRFYHICVFLDNCIQKGWFKWAISGNFNRIPWCLAWYILEQLVFPVFKMLVPPFNCHQNLHMSQSLLDIIQKTQTCTAWSFNDRSSWTVRNADAVSSSFVAWAPCLRKTRRKTMVKFSFKVTQSLCCMTNSQWTILHLHMFYSKGHKVNTNNIHTLQVSAKATKHTTYRWSALHGKCRG